MKTLWLCLFLSFSIFAGNAELIKELEELSKKLSSSELTEAQIKVIEGKIKTIRDMMKAEEDKKPATPKVDKNHYSCQTAQTMTHVSDLLNLKEDHTKLVEELKHFICNYEENPSKDIYYPNGQQAYYSESLSWNYSNGNSAFVGYDSSWIYPNGIFAHTEYDNSWYYPNGNTAYSEFYENWYYPNGTKVLESFSNDWYFPSGKRAYLSNNRTAYFPNEKTFETKVDEFNIDSLIKSLVLFGFKEAEKDDYKTILDPELKMFVRVTWLSTLL